ncbi:hypothetical protein GJU94_05700 [Brucella sp. 10RB9214]|nr:MULTISPECIES: hypothetical protein [unclassified Brucella]MRN48016.1 hypothetical protein [Brucella sp. 10RB9212]MRN49326.1 hypothetical protein [Brucella sp. 10RB9214]
MAKVLKEAEITTAKACSRLEIGEHARAEAKAADGTPITVRIAVEAYIVDRDSRRKGRPVRSDASRRLSLHLLGQEQREKREEVSEAPLARIMLHTLKEADRLEWPAAGFVDAELRCFQWNWSA